MNAFKIDIAPIQKVFGPDHPLPHLPAGPIGRFRLVESLKHRFGDNFRMHAQAKAALDHFDRETAYVKNFAVAKKKIEDQKNGD